MVNTSAPAALTFQIVTACRSPINADCGITALSGFSGVGEGDGGVRPVTNGVAPAIHMSPAGSTAAAVAIDAAD